VTQTFDNAMLELADVRLGSWRWLRYWRKLDRAAQERLIQAVIKPEKEEGNR
jgi:hypothetical protein